AAQRHDAAPGPAHVARELRQQRTAADDLHAVGMLRPGYRVRERAGAVAARVFEQHLGDLQELLLRRAADLLYHLRRVAAEVFLQELEHAARMLERRVRLRRALAQRAEHIVERAALLDHLFGGGTGRLGSAFVL